MNPIYSNFDKNASGYVEAGSRAKVIALALALALSQIAIVPSSEVDNPSAHFNMQVMPAANDVMSNFNENMVFDCRAAIDYFRMFWLIRYTAAHPFASPDYSAMSGFFECLFGVERFVPQELHDFMHKYKDKIFMLAQDARIIILQMRN